MTSPPYFFSSSLIPTTLSRNSIDDADLEGYITTHYSLSGPLVHSAVRSRRPRMSIHVLALTVYIWLLAHHSPTVSSRHSHKVSSHHRLPPALRPQKLGLVRQNAINISSHRFVYAWPPCARSFFFFFFLNPNFYPAVRSTWYRGGHISIYVLCLGVCW
jgi:hypothetical protein